ncbi:hypothetical protein KY359_01465 [Candidatus Woesearchaeota archaeon]|nr:hypothetical protein [Candidatus Woesearchaeota archaeon]
MMDRFTTGARVNTANEDRLYRIAAPIIADAGLPTTPLGMLGLDVTVRAINIFHSYDPNKYDCEEFFDILPKALHPLVKGELATAPGKEVEYHKARSDYIRKLSERIDREPWILRELERNLLTLFMQKMVQEEESPGIVDNAYYQYYILENNLKELYAMLGHSRFGYSSHVLGIDDDGMVHGHPLKKTKTLDDYVKYQNILHPHAVLFLHMEPEALRSIIPPDAEWAGDPTRLDDFDDPSNGMLGFDMHRAGREAKHFHSTLPYEVKIGHRSIDRMVVKDMPPDMIYFCTRYADRTISVGVLGVPDEEGRIVHITSEYTSFITQPVMNHIFKSKFLFDLAGCIARDMFVCEHRQQLYSESRVGKRKKNAKAPSRDRIVWLPRFKIDLVNRNKDVSYITEQVVSLSPSHVSGHPRKCKNPSASQLELAASLGIKLPPGFTYVREHDRSGSGEFRRTYKSRSAMEAMYGA